MARLDPEAIADQFADLFLVGLIKRSEKEIYGMEKPTETLRVNYYETSKVLRSSDYPC